MKSCLLWQQTGKSAKTRSTKADVDAPQSSQVKRKGPNSIKSQPKRQKTAPPSSPRPVSPIHVELSPSSPEVQTQQAPSPPQSAPQPQETLADVFKQTADPVDPIISSVVSSEQTSTTSPHSNVLSIKLSPMDLFFQTIIILIIFQLTLFYRQLQPINQWYHRHQPARGEK